MKTASYYDKFSQWYERKRGKGYHAHLDETEARICSPYLQNAMVMEAGCGTGLVLQRLSTQAGAAYGIDLSHKMLKKAAERGLAVAQADILAMPFRDDCFDLVVSFKVLAHVESVKSAIKEMVRITKPGGTLVLEFYNKFSWRYLIKQLKPPQKVASDTVDTQVYTRYDRPADVLSYLPSNTKLEKFYGVRILGPTYHFYSLPVVGQITAMADRIAMQTPIAKLGGFLVAVLKKLA